MDFYSLPSTLEGVVQNNTVEVYTMKSILLIFTTFLFTKVKLTYAFTYPSQRQIFALKSHRGVEMGGGSPVPTLTDFDSLEDATKDLTMEQLNEEKKDRERESIGLDKVLDKAMTMLGKMPCQDLVGLVGKFSPEKVQGLSDKDASDMEVLVPLAFDVVWQSTPQKDWESFFTVLNEELGERMKGVDAHMNEAILYVNEFPESFIKSLIKKYGDSNLVPRKNEVFKDNKGGKIHYTAALIALLLAQNGNDYGKVVVQLKGEAQRVTNKGFGA